MVPLPSATTSAEVEVLITYTTIKEQKLFQVLKKRVFEEEARKAEEERRRKRAKVSKNNNQIAVQFILA